MEEEIQQLKEDIHTMESETIPSLDQAIVQTTEALSPLNAELKELNRQIENVSVHVRM